MKTRSKSRSSRIVVVKCSVPKPGVEVLTLRLSDGTFRTEVNGGVLEGERYPASDAAAALAQHWSVEQFFARL